MMTDSAPNQSVQKSADDLLLDYPENLIINRPDLKTKTLLFGEGLLTVLFWGFWIYLWLPVISLIAWLFGFHILYVHMVELGGFDGLIHQLDTFSIGIALLSGSLAFWSFYNLKRYGKYNRRNKVLWTNTDQMAREFSISSEDFNDIQQSKTVRFYFSDIHEISAVDTDKGKKEIKQEAEAIS